MLCSVNARTDRDNDRDDRQTDYVDVTMESCDRLFRLVAAVLYAISVPSDEGTEIAVRFKHDDREASSRSSLFGANDASVRLGRGENAAAKQRLE